MLYAYSMPETPRVNVYSKKHYKNVHKENCSGISFDGERWSIRDDMITIIACIKYLRSELVSSDQQSDNHFTINPYDLFMLEQLKELKKSFKCRIIGMTMGPMGSTEAIKRSLASGMDDAFLVSDPCFSGSDTYATSYILSKALIHIGQAEIYAFGEKSIDGETGQVPVGVASRLALRCITGVKELYGVDDNELVLKRQFTSRFEHIKTAMPCVLSFSGFTTKEPRISLLKLKQAREFTPVILNAQTLQIDKKDCGQDGSRTIVKNTARSIHKRKSEYVEGTPQVKASAFRELILGNGGNHC